MTEISPDLCWKVRTQQRSTSDEQLSTPEASSSVASSVISNLGSNIDPDDEEPEQSELAIDVKSFEKSTHTTTTDHSTEPLNSPESDGDEISNVRDDPAFVLKPSSDQRQYRTLQLSNKLRVLLISDFKCLKCAASLSVLAGSLHDPAAYPGLAHFCEKLVFHRKPPAADIEHEEEEDEAGAEEGGKEEEEELENPFEKFIASHGGIRSSGTSRDRTVFTFDIYPSFFAQALKQFAELFVSPYLTETDIEEGIGRLNDEFGKVSLRDNERRSAVDAALSKHSHPFHRFQFGNTLSLWTRPKSTAARLSDQVLRFHQTYYSANLMHLVLLGNQKLDDLLSVVLETEFSSLPNARTKLPPWVSSPYGQEHIRTRIDILPVKNIHQLLLSFPVPDYSEYYKSGIIPYMKYIIGYEGSGSVIAFLRDQGWATRLRTEYKRPGKGFAFFTIDLDLTLSGIKNVNNIVHNIFQYLKLVQIEGPQRWLWDEVRIVEGNRLLLEANELKPFEYVKSLATTFRVYPSHHCVIGSFVVRDYLPTVIREFTNLLIPSNFRMIVTTKLNQQVVNRVEEYFGIKYRYTKIDTSHIQKWNTCELHLDLKLPSKNPFISPLLPKKTKAKSKEAQRQTSLVGVNIAIPRVIIKADLSEVWVLQSDNSLKRREALIALIIKSPLLKLEPGNYNSLCLIARVLNKSLIDTGSYARFAGIHHKIEATSVGLIITVQGADNKLELYFETILRILFDFHGTGKLSFRFQDIKEEYRESLARWKDEEPYVHAEEHVLGLLGERIWSPEQLSQAMDADRDELTPNSLMQFFGQFLSQVRLQWFFYGNWDEAELTRIYSSRVQLFFGAGSEPIFNEQKQEEAAVLIDASKVYQTQHPCHTESCCALFFQTGLGEVEDTLGTELIELMLKELLLESPSGDHLFLKTEVKYFKGCAGLQVLLQEEAENSHELETKLEDFLTQAAKKISSVSPEDFDSLKAGLRFRKREQVRSFTQKGSMLLEEILNGTHEFRRIHNELRELDKIKLDHVLSLYKNRILYTGSEKRKICILVASCLEKEIMLGGGSGNNARVLRTLDVMEEEPEPDEGTKIVNQALANIKSILSTDVTSASQSNVTAKAAKLPRSSFPRDPSQGPKGPHLDSLLKKLYAFPSHTRQVSSNNKERPSSVGKTAPSITNSKLGFRSHGSATRIISPNALHGKAQANHSVPARRKESTRPKSAGYAPGVPPTIDPSPGRISRTANQNWSKGRISSSFAQKAKLVESRKSDGRVGGPSVPPKHPTLQSHKQQALNEMLDFREPNFDFKAEIRRLKTLKKFLEYRVALMKYKTALQQDRDRVLIYGRSAVSLETVQERPAKPKLSPNFKFGYEVRRLLALKEILDKEASSLSTAPELPPSFSAMKPEAAAAPRTFTKDTIKAMDVEREIQRLTNIKKYFDGESPTLDLSCVEYTVFVLTNVQLNHVAENYAIRTMLQSRLAHDTQARAFVQSPSPFYASPQNPHVMLRKQQLQLMRSSPSRFQAALRPKPIPEPSQIPGSHPTFIQEFLRNTKPSLYSSILRKSPAQPSSSRLPGPGSMSIVRSKSSPRVSSSSAMKSFLHLIPAPRSTDPGPTLPRPKLHNKDSSSFPLAHSSSQRTTSGKSVPPRPRTSGSNWTAVTRSRTEHALRILDIRLGPNTAHVYRTVKSNGELLRKSNSSWAQVPTNAYRPGRFPGSGIQLHTVNSSKTSSNSSWRSRELIHFKERNDKLKSWANVLHPSPSHNSKARVTRVLKPESSNSNATVLTEKKSKKLLKKKKSKEKSDAKKGKKSVKNLAKTEVKTTRVKLGENASKVVVDSVPKIENDPASPGNDPLAPAQLKPLKSTTDEVAAQEEGTVSEVIGESSQEDSKSEPSSSIHAIVELEKTIAVSPVQMVAPVLGNSASKLFLGETVVPFSNVRTPSISRVTTREVRSYEVLPKSVSHFPLKSASVSSTKTKYRTAPSSPPSSSPAAWYAALLSHVSPPSPFLEKEKVISGNLARNEEVSAFQVAAELSLSFLNATTFSDGQNAATTSENLTKLKEAPAVEDAPEMSLNFVELPSMREENDPRENIHREVEAAAAEIAHKLSVTFWRLSSSGENDDATWENLSLHEETPRAEIVASGIMSLSVLKSSTAVPLEKKRDARSKDLAESDQSPPPASEIPLEPITTILKIPAGLKEKNDAAKKYQVKVEEAAQAIEIAPRVLSMSILKATASGGKSIIPPSTVLSEKSSAYMSSIANNPEDTSAMSPMDQATKSLKVAENCLTLASEIAEKKEVEVGASTKEAPPPVVVTTSQSQKTMNRPKLSVAKIVTSLSKIQNELSSQEDNKPHKLTPVEKEMLNAGNGVETPDLRHWMRQVVATEMKHCMGRLTHRTGIGAVSNCSSVVISVDPSTVSLLPVLYHPPKLPSGKSTSATALHQQKRPSSSRHENRQAGNRVQPPNGSKPSSGEHSSKLRTQSQENATLATNSLNKKVRSSNSLKFQKTAR